MTHHQGHVRMTIDISSEEYRKLNPMAAFIDITLKELVLNCL